MSRSSRYSTVNVDVATLVLIDQARAALAQDTATLSRAAFVAAAVEDYAAGLSAEGYELDVVDTEQFTDLAGTKIPFRPHADWAVVDDQSTPNQVELAIGHGPGGAATLTVVARILPHLTRGRYGGWREMLRSAGYQIDSSRGLSERQSVLADGRALIAITTNTDEGRSESQRGEDCGNNGVTGHEHGHGSARAGHPGVIDAGNECG